MRKKKALFVSMLVVALSVNLVSVAAAEEIDDVTNVGISEKNSNFNEKEQENDEVTENVEIKENPAEESELENKSIEEPTDMDENANVIPALDENGYVEEYAEQSRAITGQIVNFNTKGFSGVTSYTETDTGISGYTCGAYGADAIYLGRSGTKIKFMLSGVIGEVSASDVQIVSTTAVKSLSHYIVSGGRLYHKIATNLNNSDYGSTLDQGPAPLYLNEGIKYYSYDGHYFYTEENFDTMASDYNNGTRNYSVNSSEPYYNYFQYLPLRSQTNYSVSEINNMINGRTLSTSKMYNLGNVFIDKQNTYGVNALLAAGLAANESAWGNSNIAQTKNNLFGLNAVDTSPGQSANYYSSTENCVKDFAETFMSKQYLNPQDWKYFGGYLGNKASGINVKYASDPYWGEKAANVAWSLDKSGGNKDLNKYTIGIKDTIGTEHTALNIRNNGNTSSNIVFNTGEQSNQAFIILDEENGFYKLQSDPVLNETRTSINGTSGQYNYEKMYVYGSKQYISKVSSGKEQQWDINGINSSVSTPQTLGNEVKLSANVSGNTNGLQYKFVWMKNNWKEWGVIQDFSTVTTTVWKPNLGGNYTLYVDVKDSSGKTKTVTLNFGIKNWGISEIQTNLESPQKKKTSIQISPQIQGDKSNLQYKYVWMKDNWKEWGVIQNFSTQENATWKPTVSGEYVIYVDVKDEEGFIVSKTKQYSICDKMWSINGIDFEKDSPQEFGTNIKVSVNMKNAEKDNQYKFVWMKDNWKEWGVIQNYSSKEYTQWSPENIGLYTIYVDVKDSDGNEEHYNTKYNIVQGKWEIENIVTSPDSLQKKGEAIEIEAKITGNKAGLQYKFVWMKDNWKEWGVIQNLSFKSTAKWIPKSIGNYKIYVDVKDLTGMQTTEIISYEVTEKGWRYVSIETNQEEKIEIGTKVKIIPRILGNTEKLEYKYVWMKDNWKEWGVIKDFCSESSIFWTPTEPGEYYIYADVRAAGEKMAESYRTKVTVKAGEWEIAGLIFDEDSPQAVGNDIGLTAKIIGNKTGLQYKFVWMKDNWKEWGVIQKTGSSLRTIWSPKEAGDYKIYLDVKDVAGVARTYITEYKIEDWIINVSPKTGEKLGETVTISLEGIEHNKNMEYKYVWMKDNWKEWGVIQDFSEKQIAKWIPQEGGNYSIYVDVKNKKDNTMKTKIIKYDIK